MDAQEPGAKTSPGGAGRERGVDTGQQNRPLLPAQSLLLLEGRMSERPGCVNAFSLLLKACVAAAEQREAGVQGTHSALRAIELSPVESQRWPKRQS